MIMNNNMKMKPWILYHEVTTGSTFTFSKLFTFSSFLSDEMAFKIKQTARPRLHRELITYFIRLITHHQSRKTVSLVLLSVRTSFKSHQRSPRIDKIVLGSNEFFSYESFLRIIFFIYFESFETYTHWDRRTLICAVDSYIIWKFDQTAQENQKDKTKTMSKLLKLSRLKH